MLRVYGIDQVQDNELKLVAESLIDQTIKDMNSHLYEFNKFTETGITLVSEQNDYVLTNTDLGVGGGSPPVAATPVIPYKEVIAYLIKTDDSSRQFLTYIPWVRFSERLGHPLFNNTDIPTIYSWRNVETDGTVTVHPAPGTSVANDYTLTIEFYRRIPLYSEVQDGETIMVPEEVEVPLVYGSCKRLAIHLLGAAHPDVAAFNQLEKTSLEELKAVDKRHPDQQQRFVLSDNIKRGRLSGRRSLFIRV